MKRSDISLERQTVIPPIRGRYLWLVATLCAGFIGAAAQASDDFATVKNARIRWLPNGLPLAGYFDLTNTEKHPITLTGASSKAFQGVMMHRTVHSKGEARMLPAQNLEVQPGQTLHFAPEGYHLMLMNRSQPLAVGDQVPISLEFSGSDSMKVMFTVKGTEMQ